MNSLVLETFYTVSKIMAVKREYNKINEIYNNGSDSALVQIRNDALANNFDILIKTDTNLIIFTSDREFLSSTYILKDINEIKSKSIEENETKINVKVTTDEVNNVSYMFLTGILDNGYVLYIRMPISPIEESVKISNTVLLMIGGITLVVAGIIASFISRKFTNPILQLNDIANKMSKLDFSQKYRITDTEDEINELGRSINTMSDKLEATIKELQKNNIELEKDIEEKSKIDEMNKMDKLVKQLLELMKLEYGKREFDNEKFNINELINEVLRKCSVMINEKNIKVYFENKEPIYVYADEFYMDQIITNYLTNAIKHAEEVEKETKIEIKVEKVSNKIRVSVFNTGENIPEEDLQRIWGRFYKLDSSRNRQDGGSGIGLALVKAIMNNYQNEYGVENKKNGVEFYFDMDISD